MLAKLPGGKEPLEQAYQAIETRMVDIRKYVGEWLRYQALWDLQPDQLYGKLGEDIDLWLKCLADIKYVLI